MDFGAFHFPIWPFFAVGFGSQQEAHLLTPSFALWSD
jgi:hypothetical protein